MSALKIANFFSFLLAYINCIGAIHCGISE
jgi:hypothetical protein